MFNDSKGLCFFHLSSNVDKYDLKTVIDHSINCDHKTVINHSALFMFFQDGLLELILTISLRRFGSHQF